MVAIVAYIMISRSTIQMISRLIHNPTPPPHRRLQRFLRNNIMSLPKTTPELILAHSPSGDIVLDGLNSTFQLKKDLPLPYCEIARFSYSPFISPTIRPNVP